MNKYELIQQILETKKMTPSQKERFFLLVTKEVKKESETEKELIDRLDSLEKKINRELPSMAIQSENFVDIDFDSLFDNAEIIDSEPNSKSEIENNNSATSIKINDINKSSVDYEDPSRLYRFLLGYNQDTLLKSTCHDFDMDMLNDIFGEDQPYDFAVHLEKIKTSFSDLQKRYHYRGKMSSLIYKYLNGGAWSTQKIEFGWSSTPLKNWCLQNIGIMPHPNDILIERFENEGYKLEIPFKSLYTEKEIRSFTDFVLFFKSLWHIKKGNNLKSLVEIRNKSYGFGKWAEIKIADRFSTTTNLYTDVDKLLQAYSLIISMVRQIYKEDGIAQKPEFIIDFYEETTDNSIAFSIHNINSVFGKNINSTVEKPFGQLMTPIIKNQINGLCDLYLRAEFEGGQYAEINLWDNEHIEAKPLSHFKGVEYLLKFRK